jgi:hypothetical protein
MYDEILERKLKQHEESGERDENHKDLMDILLKVYQDDKAEVKITRIHIKALLLVSHVFLFSQPQFDFLFSLNSLINYPFVWFLKILVKAKLKSLKCLQ